MPLSDVARNALAEMERVEGDAGYLFTTNGTSSLKGFYKGRNYISKRMLQIASEEACRTVEIPHWTWHDLRRTTATGMARLGIPVRVTEAVLNHVSGSGGGIVGVYQRHDYAHEKRDALEAWARFVGDLVDVRGNKVVRVGMELK